MDTTHSTTLLFHNTMRITDGHLEDFRAAIRRAVDFTRGHGPRLTVEVLLDEERMLAHSFQLCGDSGAVLLHWRISDPYVQGVMAHCTVRSVEVFGEPSQAVRDGLGPDRAGSPVAFHPRLAGFTRPLGERVRGGA